MDTKKRLDDIVSELFEQGKRYGEELGFGKDDVLYERRTSACDDAIKEINKILSESIQQAIAEERDNIVGEAEKIIVTNIPKVEVLVEGMMTEIDNLERITVRGLWWVQMSRVNAITTKYGNKLTRQTITDLIWVYSNK